MRRRVELNPVDFERADIGGQGPEAHRLGRREAVLDIVRSEAGRQIERRFLFRRDARAVNHRIAQNPVAGFQQALLGVDALVKLSFSSNNT